MPNSPAKPAKELGWEWLATETIMGFIGGLRRLEWPNDPINGCLSLCLLAAGCVKPGSPAAKQNNHQQLIIGLGLGKVRGCG